MGSVLAVDKRWTVGGRATRRSSRKPVPGRGDKRRESGSTAFCGIDAGGVRGGRGDRGVEKFEGGDEQWRGIERRAGKEGEREDKRQVEQPVWTDRGECRCIVRRL